MRANRYDVEPAVPAMGNERVTCSLHRTQRLAKFCDPTPVCNADRVLIDYTYQCREDSRCAGAMRSSGVSLETRSTGGTTEDRGNTFSVLMSGVSFSADNDEKEAAGEDVDQQRRQQEVSQQRGPSRYYDLANQRGSGAKATRKVCWNCGMEGHEKPDCPNALCRTCHGVRDHHHFCQAPKSSPFVTMSPTLPLSEEMKNVQCISCSAMGHFDCSSRREIVVPSCCNCGDRGHSAYDCCRVSDRWITRALYPQHYDSQRGSAIASNSSAAQQRLAHAAADNRYYDAGRGCSTSSRAEGRYADRWNGRAYQTSVGNDEAYKFDSRHHSRSDYDGGGVRYYDRAPQHPRRERGYYDPSQAAATGSYDRQRGRQYYAYEDVSAHHGDPHTMRDHCEDRSASQSEYDRRMPKRMRKSPPRGSYQQRGRSYYDTWRNYRRVDEEDLDNIF
uniref:Putative nucleic acid binding protein n=1 Tax=Trypanosoma vivax (strain Y486) TaxID=1055687 RepID=G0UBL7_TRYVY|nr:putative nucleic acid binding protein [Trypanosoma vivax Y486]